nr:tRNA (guanine(46)-N(7))-methyltransferase TrmB [Acidibrevibacterium fodinaquatile]
MGALRVKKPPERLYGRQHGHALRPRQVRLLAETLPRLRFDPAAPLAGLDGFEAVAFEIGFGGGEHALAEITAHPETALIACEVYANGLASLLGRLVPEGGEASAPLPANLRIWGDDARIALRAMPAASLSRVFLLFPDPWPKARHAKRRFVHPENLPLVARALRPGGEWRIATDDPTYQAWVGEVLAAQRFFAPATPMTTRPPDWAPTRYEAKALAVGRTPLYWSLRRV